MDYWIFFAIWIFGGIAFFMANRVQPLSGDAIATVEEDNDDVEDDENSEDEVDSEESNEEEEGEEASDEAD